MVLRVAVLEPDTRERTLLEKTLKRKGYQPVEHDLNAETINQRLSMAFQFEVLAPLADAHLIIMESRFPGLDGITLIRLLKENKYTVHIPILVISLDRHYESVLSCIKAGAGDYLVKPVDEATLIRRISLLLGQNGSMEPGQGVESVVWNFQDYLVRELKRSERSRMALSIILGRIGTSEEFQEGGRSIRAAKEEQIDLRLKFCEQFIAGVRDQVRQYDTILQYGPQGLICVLPMTPKDGAFLVEERMTELFRTELSAGDVLELRRLQLLTGVSSFPDEATSKHDLLSKAEEDLSSPDKSKRLRGGTSRVSDKQVFLKELFCPVCNTRFQMEKIRETAVQIKDWESDFRPVYASNVNPLFYAIPVCPKCYYAAFFADFERVSETECVKIKKERMERGRLARQCDYRQPRTLESAVLSYRLAGECYAQRKVESSTLARLFHRSAWLLREAGQKAEEKKMLQKALACYERAFLKEDLTGKRLSDLEVTYLIGELCLRLGRPKRALEYLSAVMKAKGGQARQSLIQMATGRWKDAKRAAERSH